LLCSLFIFTNCGDDDNVTTPTPETPNAVDFAAADENFSALVAAVTKAGLAPTLSGDGPFTIFAPTNAAFQDLLDSNADWNSLDDIPNDVLTTVLTYHVVAGDVKSTDLSNGYVESLSATPYDANASLYVNIDNGVTINGTTTVIAADNNVSNGVIHAVDKVILPPNVVTFATSNPAFTSLVAALTRTGLMTDFVAALSGEGPFTVFAPTNDAFQALLDSNPDWSALEDIPVEALEDVLKYHVTGAGNVRSTALVDGQEIPTLLGEPFNIDLSNGAAIVTPANTANIILTDVQGQNGVVHAIDAVLLPSAFASAQEPNAVQFAQANPDFSILVDAVVKAGLAETLSGAGPFTIFAPTNDAFVALLNSNDAWSSLDDIPVDVLTSVLTYHVVSGDVRSTDLSTGYVSTLSGTPFDANTMTSKYINIDNGGVQINGSTNVTSADNVVSNGVIHVIDEVIMPANIVTFATSNPMFSTLVAALTRDDLSVDFVSALSGEGPLTVFAPTNDAFQALLDSNMDWNALADIPASVLESVLLYHVTSAGNVRSTDLSNGQSVPTLLTDNSFLIDLSGATPAITATSNNANIVATDVQATNGVIHVIDTVILPQL